MSQQAQRTIIHVDMDAFYASVEQRDRPELRGKPVVVGGSPHSRGVVAAASYEARRFGIHSAMPCYQAWRLCPETVFVAPDFSRYSAVSRQIRAIFAGYTDRVEPLGLDEAYLDVSERCPVPDAAIEVARAIKAAIRAETGLTASAGVAPNKFLAKIASDERKPDGLFAIRPAEVAAFVATLALGKVPGIGRVTEQGLEALGLHTCGDVQRLSPEELARHFGRRGLYFHRLCRGEDDRPVSPERIRKSVSIEDTFERDQGNPYWLERKLAELARGLEGRLRAGGHRGRTLTLKLRLADFTSATRSVTEPEPFDDAPRIRALAVRLYRHSGLAGQKLRLLGLGLSHLETGSAPGPRAQQLALPLDLRAEVHPRSS
ncbi:MAG: DNA polymerase IV [Candidatus Lambdaproteobacteria bacterium]|nr:DNA polymerase IV [Candidatus Lambdaproteobacteria bacterium]